MPAVRKTRNKLYRRLNHRQVFTCVCLRTFFCSSISMGLQYFWILQKSDKIFLKSEQPIEIDGDFFDYGPAKISVKKHSIQLKI